MSKTRDGVRYIKDDTYEISYYPCPESKRKWERIKAGSLKEARLIRSQRMIEQGAKRAVSDKSSFEEIRNRLELKLKSDNLTYRTIYHNLIPKYDSLIKFLKRENFTNINQLTREAVEKYKQWVVVDCKRTTGWRDELTKLRTIIRKLIDIGLCDKRIYEILLQFKKPPRTKKLYKEISKAQMLKLLNYIKDDRPDYYGVTYIIMRLGWRREQVLSIKRHNIKWLGLRPSEIHIEPQDTKTKEPFVFRDIDAEMANVLKRYLTDHRKTIWLFPNSNNNKHHSNHYTEYIRRVSNKVLGITLSPHDFRHSFCTTRLKEGSTPRDIMAITGHRDEESFKIYTHPTSEGTKKVVERSRLL